MIVGKGLIATQFNTYGNDNDILIFASGVSNSKNENEIEFQRELSLIEKTISKHQDKLFIYFSTCSIEDPSLQTSRYVIHKKLAEEYIQKYSRNFIIFRLSNVVGITRNQNTVFNYFVNAVRDNLKINLWQYAERNFIDVEHVYLIIQKCLKLNLFKNEIVNVANPYSINVIDFYENICSYFNKEKNYLLFPKGQSFKISLKKIEPIIHELNINFDETYITFLLNKYCYNEL